MSGEITARIDYQVQAGGELRISHSELRERGVHMEDWQAVERAVRDIVRQRIKDGAFDPFHDWTEYNHGDFELLDLDPGNDIYIDWDDLTAEEQARVPENQRP